MIYKTILASALALAAGTSGASAQNFSGNLGFNYAHPTDSEDLSVSEYFGGLEYAINRNFAIALDLSSYDIEDTDETIVSSTWHLIYHVNETASVGLFAGADVIADDTEYGVVGQSLSFAGFEAGSEFGDAEAEAYFGFSTTDGADEDFTMFGASGEYAIASGFSATGAADFINSDSYDQSKISVGVEYEISGGPEVYGKIGRRASDDDGDEGDSNFIEIGASVSFGANRGTTFNGRSFFESFPTF
jgi:hypothetical protein